MQRTTYQHKQSQTKEKKYICMDIQHHAAHTPQRTQHHAKTKEPPEFDRTARISMLKSIIAYLFITKQLERNILKFKQV